VDATRQRIVVGVDGSAGARAALVWAMTEAARRRADIEVVTAFPVDFYWTDAYLLDTRRIEVIRSDTEGRARAMIDEVRRDTSAASPGAGDVDVQLLVVAGSPAVHLVARSEGAALLVVGSRGRGSTRSAIAGSVALHCSAHAKCPVVVVHATTATPDEPARVVVGLDDSEPGRTALAAAVAQAAALDARVDAVLAYQPLDYWSDPYGGMAPPLGETREQALTRGQVIVADVLGPAPVERGRVRVLAVEGPPRQTLVHEAAGARLLVVGSRGRNQLRGLLLGSVALHCVMHAPCPVLVIHPQPDGFAEATAPAAVTAAPAG
jgi:nucleotide-binding universal stress UspA family protein